MAIGISFRKLGRGLRKGLKKGLKGTLKVAPALVSPLTLAPAMFARGGGSSPRAQQQQQQEPGESPAEEEEEMAPPYDDVEGEVLGDVMGDYDDNVVGRRRRRRAPAGGQMVRVPPKPAWRQQIAPGVPMPGQGLQPLPLQPNLNGGVFTAAITAITFTARPQVPFKPQRYVTTVRRSGAAGVIIQATSLFVGRDLQLVELGNFDIEQYSATAFDMKLQLSQAEPGVLISIPCVSIPAAAGADTVAVAQQFLGFSIV